MSGIPCENCNQLIRPDIYYMHVLLCSLTQDVVNNAEVEVSRRAPLPAPIPVIEKTECPICYETIKKTCRELPCGHTYCSDCIASWWRRQANCPVCKREY